MRISEFVNQENFTVRVAVDNEMYVEKLAIKSKGTVRGDYEVLSRYPFLRWVKDVEDVGNDGAILEVDVPPEQALKEFKETIDNSPHSYNTNPVEDDIVIVEDDEPENVLSKWNKPEKKEKIELFSSGKKTKPLDKKDFVNNGKSLFHKTYLKLSKKEAIELLMDAGARFDKTKNRMTLIKLVKQNVEVEKVQKLLEENAYPE